MDGMEKLVIPALILDAALLWGCVWGGEKLYHHFHPPAAPTAQQIIQMKDSPARNASIDNILRSNGVPAGHEPLVREVILHEGGECALLNDSLGKSCEAAKRTFGLK